MRICFDSMTWELFLAINLNDNYLGIDLIKNP
jgi:hypothetical protein